ncbi:MAG: hypothetical protein EAZ30_09025 [Betaproteobacteria bacterium]|nr:MAG: hypothetical protein EAZ43_12785 [Betaproteobacteria bacterium]TAG47670.1 MAG: hypothetical protein EAZ30_09025 [Betaproteobacteria bacterium]
MHANSSVSNATSNAQSSASAFHDSLTAAMNAASFVQVGEAVFSADYLHAPDEFTCANDVLVEGSCDDQELLLIQQDFEGASFDAEGEIHLRDGTLIRFLRSAAVH